MEALFSTHKKINYAFQGHLPCVRKIHRIYTDQFALNCGNFIKENWPAICRYDDSPGGDWDCID
jgi:hypothetical protein